jgi:hypothetical protein
LRLDLPGFVLGDRPLACGPGMERRRSVVFRWYTDPASRRIYPEEDHELHGRDFTAQLHEAVARDGPRSPAAKLADALRECSEEFCSDPTTAPLSAA